jgi:ATP-dependent DNA helicase RecQ
LQEGYALKARNLLPSSSISPEQQSKVFEAFDRFGAERLRPVFEACNEAINYNELKLLRLHYLIERS